MKNEQPIMTEEQAGRAIDLLNSLWIKQKAQEAAESAECQAAGEVL